ncbi:uncharacterized protein PV09_04167 [Verruconis gallopava]|uniref:Protein dml1 n=1 Tax=Verruconis gallopava TaxID=253628 RepID=A0A0D2AF06_9PEZI|nr:uncharacterized protein PV09_04167 [Verruconis gallopava]KIW05010.1 hypothetical protein PV09_04167 [Verruconis gallopava]
MHEIVTLQFGNQSNYIGTHFWNAQESYFTYTADEESAVDHDVHFRPGIGSDGSETFTPRVVIYDVKDNFGALRQVNALYEIQNEDASPAGVWTSDPILHHHPAIPPHPYQVALDAGTVPSPISAPSVRYWSDFNRVFYHPRSMVHLIPPTSHLSSTPSSQVEPLDQWEVGEELFKSEDQEHDLIDRDLRLFVEECDQMQGFQILTGADDAWAAFAGRYVESIRDEYGRKSIWIWGTEAVNRSESREKRRKQALNVARSTAIFASQASLYMPISTSPVNALPWYVDRAMQTRWQTSGLQATLIESVTLPTRLRNTSNQSRGLMIDIEPIFTNDAKRNILAASMSASIPNEKDRVINGDSARDHRMINGIDSDHESNAKEPEQLDIDLFHRTLGDPNQRRNAQQRTHIFSQVDVLRGDFVSSPSLQDPTDLDAPIVQTYSSELLFPRPSSFPNIFHFPSIDPESGVEVKSAMSASTAVTDRLRFLADFARSSTNVDEREALRADLLARSEEYVEGWEDEHYLSDDE